MSRIYDALKKAEQEKARLGGEERSTGAIAPDSPNLERWGVSPLATGEAPATNAAGKTDPALEALLTHCRAEGWSFDASRDAQVDPLSQRLVTEEFRSLRSRLYLLRKAHPLRKLLVSSPLPQEGKTFVAANLAQVIARQPDCRVLLIDANLRIPALHATLGTHSAPGLSEYLESRADLAAVIQRGTSGNFFFLPAGDAPADPADLVSNGRFESLLKWVMPAFEWIIIDSPAVIPVSDARLLAGFCDGVILLINAGTTPFDLAQKACREFPKNLVLGAILNRVDLRQDYRSQFYNEQGQKKNGKVVAA